MRSLLICTAHKSGLDFEIQVDEMGGACSIYGGEEKHFGC